MVMIIISSNGIFTVLILTSQKVNRVGIEKLAYDGIARDVNGGESPIIRGAVSDFFTYCSSNSCGTS